VSSELLRLAVAFFSGPNSAATVTHSLTYGLALVGMYALLPALTAVYFGHQRALGVAALGSGAFSRPAAAFVVIGGTCGIPLALSTPHQIPLTLAVRCIGYTLIRASRHELPVHRTAPASGVVGELLSR
jgi:hypothetical protein